MGKARFAIGALVGAVAGVIAGFLTAPKAGKDTRADIKAKAGELKRDASGKVKSAKKHSENLFEDAKDKAEEYKERSEHMVKGAKEGLKSKDKKKR